MVASSHGLPSSSAAGENTASLVEVSTSSMIEGTEEGAALAAGAAALVVLLLFELGISPPNAAHPLRVSKEKRCKRIFRTLGTISPPSDAEMKVPAPSRDFLAAHFRFQVFVGGQRHRARSLAAYVGGQLSVNLRSATRQFRDEVGGGIVRIAR